MPDNIFQQLKLDVVFFFFISRSLLTLLAQECVRTRSLGMLSITRRGSATAQSCFNNWRKWWDNITQQMALLLVYFYKILVLISLCQSSHDSCTFGKTTMWWSWALKRGAPAGKTGGSSVYFYSEEQMKIFYHRDLASTWEQYNFLLSH